MPRRGKLIPLPGHRPPATPAGERDLVEVHRCAQPEAAVVRSLLESEGIPTLLRSHLVSSIHPFSVGGQGEVVILVPEIEAPRSRRLLMRLTGGSTAGDQGAGDSAQHT